MIRIAMMNVLMFSLFVSHVLHIFGRLTVIRENTDFYTELTCFSEDDGGALVWNEESFEKSRLRFHNVDETPLDKGNINCKMNENDDCLKLWIGENWNLTNSLKTPLGAVFDQRWEDFEIYGNASFNNFNKMYHMDLKNATAFAFSILTSQDEFYILLCNGSDYYKDFCYWIIISIQENFNSGNFRRCPIGIWNDQVLKTMCAQRDPSDLRSLSTVLSTEWQTFVVRWDFRSQYISVYDSIRNIIIFEYRKGPSVLETGEIEDIEIFNHYHMFIGGYGKIIYRFHIYSFLHTTVEDITLISPVFQFNNTICIQLSLGLCAECEINIALRNERRIIVLKTVKSLSNAKDFGLPTWQFVTIKHSVDFSGSAIMTLTSKLSSHSSNPLWAVANVRHCPKPESFRRSDIRVPPEYTAQCQKLFYNDQSIVSVKNPEKNITSDHTDCPEDRIGPNCLFYCKNNENGNNNCKGYRICYKEGCTCAPGFGGNTCSKSCETNKYGHSCKKTCGSCRTNPTSSSTDLCNKITGVCLNDCVINQEKAYVPPLCQTSIDKPDIPTIYDVDETSIKIKLLIPWKDEYERKLFYAFIIKPSTSNINGIFWRPVSRDQFWTGIELVEQFTNLEPGTIYNIKCLLRICNEYGLMCSNNIESKYQEAETTCHPANFVLKPEGRSLSIDWINVSNQLFPCPANWYELLIQYNDMPRVILNAEIGKFPYKVPFKLLANTLFNATILHKNKQIFSQIFRTLEEAPSIVLNPRSINVTDTNVTLSWIAPIQSHGIIQKYEVILQIIEYLECEHSRSNLNNSKTIHWTINTIITIQNLHPYARYSAKIVVYNEQGNSEPAEIVFMTDESDVAMEVYSQLNVMDWILKWEPPEDCTTITGSLYSRIKIRRINDDAGNFPIVKQTQNRYLFLNKLKLFGAEQYVARVFAIRKVNAPENPFAYQEIAFITPPGIPPKVTNLDVYETDTRQDPVIYLRWQSPTPPLNGTLRGYSIRLCDVKHDECSYIQIQLNEICNLWDNYICGSIELKGNIDFLIEVVAYNMNVSEPGLPFRVSQEMVDNLTPQEPGNFTVMNLNRGIVELEWHHPWKTGSHLDYFFIMINLLSTNLVKLSKKSLQDQNSSIKIMITDYMRKYRIRLYLHPSTQYHISIKAVTVAGISSKVAYKKFETASSLKFDGPLEYETHDSTITLNIPPVLNYTKHSMIHIIVKGPLKLEDCKGYLKVPKDLQALADVDVSHVAWEAAEILVDNQQKDVNKPFIFGNNKMYEKAKNCKLQPKESYDITIIVTGDKNSHVEPIVLKITIFNGEIPWTPLEAWLVPVILFLIMVAVFFYFYLLRKKRITKLMSQDEIALRPKIQKFEYKINSKMINSQQSILAISDRQSSPKSISEHFYEEIKEITFMVKVEDFDNYVKHAIQTGMLDNQFKNFPKAQNRSCAYGNLRQNKSKNRYEHLIPYDDTRVALKILADNPHSDYINASYITGYKKEKHYIATQGPKSNTIIDFWRMIWQEKVLIICMLTNIVENKETKCEQYWPDVGNKKQYGNISVLNAMQHVSADYCFRTFEITYGKETRKVEHLHYTAWPDYGIPLYTHSVVTYLKKLLATSPGNGSVVVHCSSGVGRTGVIILCDICLHRAAAEGIVDVFTETISIRNESVNILHSKRQYLLAHLVLMECLLSIPTTLPCNMTLLTKIKELKEQLPIQQYRLQNTAWQDEVLRQTTPLTPLSECNRAKNRFPELILDKISRIYLKRHPALDEDSDYLSAVYVDGVKLQKQYLAAQLPMPSTINDFWRMIAEFKVELILMLQLPDFQDPTCCAIAPANGEFKPMPYLNITAEKITELEYYTSQKLLLVDNSEKPSRKRSVTVLGLTNWKPGRYQPPPPVMTMVKFWQTAERIARGDGPTVTLCHDGVTGCGLYLALSFLLERMAVEKEFDVCLAVRTVRRSRPDFVESLEHLEYLYNAAVEYLEHFEGYANFL